MGLWLVFVLDLDPVLSKTNLLKTVSSSVNLNQKIFSPEGHAFQGHSVPIDIYLLWYWCPLWNTTPASENMT